jgi:[methyl-Co(III) methanol-specific corrinoid protein]:coenzyme M methyltransferase
VEKFLLMSLDDPGRTKACLDRLKEATVQFGVAQLEAGADALTLPDHATGDLVSGEYYDRFLKELHKELVERIPIPLILHICGRTVDRMGFIAETGMAAFHYDSKNKPKESMEAVAGRIALIGNINNPQTLFARGPEEVHDEVIANLEAGVQLIGPECAIPLQTPLENLTQIAKSVREWHAQRATRH